MSIMQCYIIPCYDWFVEPAAEHEATSVADTSAVRNVVIWLYFYYSF